MYNINITCTYSFYDSTLREKYHKNDNFDVNDVIEFEEFADIVYKAELLQILHMENAFIKEDVFFFNKEQMTNIFKNVELHNKFMECIKRVKEYHLCNSMEDAFLLLFSYDYLFLSHKCICQLLQDNKIDDTLITELLCAIK
jgi:hypothetical protein